MESIIEFAKGLPPWVILGFGVVTGSLRTEWSFIYRAHRWLRGQSSHAIADSGGYRT